jgi:hypothetical protein
MIIKKYNKNVLVSAVKCFKGIRHFFPSFSRTAEQKFTKLSRQIDLDECSKSCARLKISRFFLQRDMAVTRTKTDLSPLPPRILMLHFSGLKFFSEN